MSKLVMLWGLFFICGVHNLIDRAKCTYMCDDPVCNALCSALCEAPSCRIPPRYANTLVCETRCPPSSCLDKSACPACALKSNNDTNTVLCNRFCTPPVCACSCIKPTNCPLPQCQLMCEKHSCEATIDPVIDAEPTTVIAEEGPNEQEQQQEVEPEDPDVTVVVKNPKKKANSHNSDNHDWENEQQVDESWAWVWVFFFGFFFFFFLCGIFFWYGDAPYYYYPDYYYPDYYKGKQRP